MKTVMSSSRFSLPVPVLKRYGLAVSNEIFLILVFCLLTVIGCFESQEPVGETPIGINPQEWEGTWVSLDKKTDTLVLQVVDAPQGILLMKKTIWNDWKKQVDSRTSVLYLRKSGDWLFASWKQEFEDKGFLWGRTGNWAMKDGRRVILFWLPDFEKVPRLITRGELPGRLVGGKEGKQEILGPLLPKHYRVLRDREKDIFSEGPAVFIRQAKQQR